MSDEPITRLRVKKLKETFNGINKNIWDKISFKASISDDNTLINFIHAKKRVDPWAEGFDKLSNIERGVNKFFFTYSTKTNDNLRVLYLQGILIIQGFLANNNFPYRLR